MNWTRPFQQCKYKFFPYSDNNPNRPSVIFMNMYYFRHSIMHLSGSNKAISAFLKANILDFFSSALFIMDISVIKLSFWWRNFTFSVLMSKFSSIFRDTSSFNLKKSVVVVVDSSLFSCLILTLFVGHSGLKIEKKNSLIMYYICIL